MDRLAKTMASIVGVLFPAKALGGYIDAKSGKHLAFTIVASNSVFSSIEGAFAANAGADFDCRLQRIGKRGAHSPAPAPFKPCASPRTYRHLAHGRYRFQVRAVNASGPDRSPAGKRFIL
jgi:hypothetical protein